MSSQEILQWLGLRQGTASKSSIVRIWRAFKDDGCAIYVTPGSTFERAGLRVGNNYSLMSAMTAVGCELE